MADAYSHKGFTVGLGLFSLLLAIYALGQSPLFALRAIELVGNERLTESRVLAESGIAYGTSLLEIDTGHVAKALSGLPIVAEVTVSRRFPSTIVVRVVERTPVAYLHHDGFWTVDADGVVLYRSDSLNEALPLVTTQPPVTVEGGVHLDQPYLLAALRFAGALSLSGLSELSEIHTSPSEMTAYTRNRITVELGVAGDMEEKAALLEALFEKAGEGRLPITRIDLRRPRNPVVEQRR